MMANRYLWLETALLAAAVLLSGPLQAAGAQINETIRSLEPGLDRLEQRKERLEEALPPVGEQGWPGRALFIQRGPAIGATLDIILTSRTTKPQVCLDLWCEEMVEVHPDAMELHPARVAVGELDHDGIPADIVLSGTQTHVCTHDRQGAMDCQRVALDDVNPNGVEIADMNGDGRNDFVVAEDDRNVVCLNGASGLSFTCHRVAGDRITNDVALADMDGDGDVDIVEANEGTANRACLNEGAGTRFGCHKIEGASRSEAVALGPFDRDNSSTDIVFANGDSDPRANQLCVNGGSGAAFSCTDIGDTGKRSADVTVTSFGPSELGVAFANSSGPNTICEYRGDSQFECVDIVERDPYDVDDDQAEVGRRTVAVAAGWIDDNQLMDLVFVNNESPYTTSLQEDNQVCLDAGELLDGQRAIECENLNGGPRNAVDLALANLDGDSEVRIVLDSQPESDRQVYFRRMAGDRSGDSFYLDDDSDHYTPNEHTFISEGAGVAHRVEVTTGTPWPWVLHEIRCDGDETAPDLLGASARITPDFGEEITCTFVYKNNDHTSGSGDVRLLKTARPNTKVNTRFQYRGNLGAFTIVPAKGVLHQRRDLVAGRYSIHEEPTAGYVVRDAKCRGTEGTDWSSNIGSRYQKEGSLNILVRPGEQRNCEFENDELGDLTIVKQTRDASGTVETSHAFAIHGGLYDAGKFNDELDTDAATNRPDRITHSDVYPSSRISAEYQFSENLDGISTWVLADIDCHPESVRKTLPANEDEFLGRELNGVRFDLTPGGSSRCTFKNVQGGGIVIDQQTYPDDTHQFHYELASGGNVLGSFDLQDGSPPQSGDIRAGRYRITQSGAGKWTLNGIDCTDPSGGTSFDLSASRLDIDLAAGEVVECTFYNTGPADFGDAPDAADKQGYPTLRAHGGAVHPIKNGIHLGARVDAENDGKPDSDASGDDSTGRDDEDGITFLTDPLQAGQTAEVEIDASSAGKVSAWIDFTQDESWDDRDRILNDYTVNAGINRVRFNVPTGAFNGSTFARFRFSTSGQKSPGGVARNGEVEDYRVEITGGEPVPDTEQQRPDQMLDLPAGVEDRIPPPGSSPSGPIETVPDSLRK